MMRYCELRYPWSKNWYRMFVEASIEPLTGDYKILMHIVRSSLKDIPTDNPESTVLEGIYIFCNHEDYGGDFTDDSCVMVSKALKRLMDSISDGTLEVRDSDAERIEELYRLFNSVPKDGIVRIW